jgi:hypothetical protein
MALHFFSKINVSLLWKRHVNIIWEILWRSAHHEFKSYWQKVRKKTDKRKVLYHSYCYKAYWAYCKLNKLRRNTNDKVLCICLSVFLAFCPYVCLSVSVCLSCFLSICMSFCVCLSFYICVSSVCLSVNLCVCLSFTHQNVRLSVWLYVCVCLSAWLPAWLSVCPSVRLTVFKSKRWVQGM